MKICMRGMALLMVGVSIVANDEGPTFNLKNKSPNRKMALAINGASNKSAKYMRIRSEEGLTVYEGLHEPSQAILVLPKHDVTYYDLHNIESLDIFYVDNELKVDHIKFVDTTDATTYYVKWCRWISDNFSSNPCSTPFGPQEGVREKLFGKKKTTDGYSLEHNVTDMNIAWADGKAGSVGEIKKYTSGKWSSKSIGKVQLPSISFDVAERDYKQLVR